MPINPAATPTVIQKRKPISRRDGSQILASYLQAAELIPALHPDAFLTRKGPIFGLGGDEGSLCFHLLRRIQRGMAGEVLAPDTYVPKLGEEQELGQIVIGAGEVTNAIEASVPVAGKTGGAEARDLGWEDGRAWMEGQDEMNIEQEIDLNTNQRAEPLGLVVEKGDAEADWRLNRKQEKKARRQKEKKRKQDARDAHLDHWFSRTDEASLHTL